MSHQMEFQTIEQIFDFYGIKDFEYNKKPHETWYEPYKYLEPYVVGIFNHTEPIIYTTDDPNIWFFNALYYLYTDVDTDEDDSNYDAVPVCPKMVLDKNPDHRDAINMLLFIARLNNDKKLVALGNKYERELNRKKYSMEKSRKKQHYSRCQGTEKTVEKTFEKTK